MTLMLRLAPLVLLLIGLPVAAQDHPTAVLLRTHAGEGIAEGTVHGFDRVLRQRIDAADVVSIEGSVELDLEAVQLALGCMGESESCLRAVAEETGGALLIFSSIDLNGGERVISVQLFDTRDASLRRAVRTVGGDAEILAAADPIVRELWDLPDTVAGEGPGDEPPVTRPATPGLSPVPFVLIGIGAAAMIGGGVALGLGFADRDRVLSYRYSAGGATMQELDAVLAIQDQAATELLAGSILLAAGGALTVAGIGWALGAGREDGSSPLSVLPLVGPDGVGLVIAGTLPGGSL